MSQNRFFDFLRSKFPDEKIEYEYEDGKHIAYISDAITLVANTITPYVTVLWGSGHQAMIEV